MGLFDTIHIHKKFLPEIPEIKESGYDVELGNFQTKSFDNFLEDYYVDESGKLSFDNTEYEFIKNKKTSKKGKWNPPFFQKEKSRNRMFSAFNGIAEVYTYLSDSVKPKNEIFVSFLLNFNNGLLEKIELSEKMITPLQVILDRNKKLEAIRTKRKNDKVYFICAKLISLVSKITSKLNKFENWLRKYEPK